MRNDNKYQHLNQTWAISFRIFLGFLAYISFASSAQAQTNALPSTCPNPPGFVDFNFQDPSNLTGSGVGRTWMYENAIKYFGEDVDIRATLVALDSVGATPLFPTNTPHLESIENGTKNGNATASTVMWGFGKGTQGATTTAEIRWDFLRQDGSPIAISSEFEFSDIDGPDTDGTGRIETLFIDKADYDGHSLTSDTTINASSDGITDQFDGTIEASGLDSMAVKFQIQNRSSIRWRQRITNFGTGSSGRAGFGINGPPFTVDDCARQDLSDASTYPEASHVAFSQLTLGSGIDADSASVANSNATGDTDDAISSFPALNENDTSYSLTVDVNNASSVDATVYGWVDFNDNGSFDSEEFSSTTVNPGDKSVQLNWSSLTGLVAGDTFARLRLTTESLSATDASTDAPDGEVEDYALTISQAPSFPPLAAICENPPGFAEAHLTSITNDTGAGANRSWTYPNALTYLGESVDINVDVINMIGGTDFDSISVSTNKASTVLQDLPKGTTPDYGEAEIRWSFVRSSNQSPIAVSLQGEIGDLDLRTGRLETVRFNRADYDGFSVAAPSTIDASSDGVIDRFDGTIDDNSLPSQAMKFTIKNKTSFTWRQSMQRLGTGSSGRAGFAVVLDGFQVDDCAPDDLSDASGFPQAQHKAFSQLTLGSTIDADTGSVANGDATGDTDDGVASFATLTDTDTNYAVTVAVNNAASVPANLYAWIDFDGNGNFDSGEFTSTSVNPGDSSAQLNWSGLSDLVSGDTFARIRLTTETFSASDVSTDAPDGEVEDYSLTIEKGTTIVPPAFPAGGGLSSSMCEATPATNPFQDIGLRWTYNDNGGTSPNAGIDQTNFIASANPATFSGVSGQVNSFDLNLNADQIPATYNPNTYIEYSFKTQNFSNTAEFTGFGATVFEATRDHHIQDTGAYHIAIAIDEDPAFASPDILINDLAFDGIDVSAASASTGPSDTGQYEQNFAHWDANGDVVNLSPNTSYKLRVFPYGVTRSGKDNNQPFSNVVIFDDFMPKLKSCTPPGADLVTQKTLASTDATPAVGDTVTYDITVTNNGPIEATNVSLTDLLPEGLTATKLNGQVTDGKYDQSSGLWSLGNLANGASATLTLEGIVDEGQGGRTIENTLASPASGDQNDPTTDGDDLTESVTVEAASIPPAFPAGGGLSSSMCEATPATNPFQDIGLRWTYNDNGGTSPNAGIDQTNFIASANPATFSGVSGQVNSFDLNLNADQIPATYNPNTYIEYSFKTQNFSNTAEFTGFGATVFEATRDHHIQDTGAYHIAIAIDEDPAFASPDILINDLAFDGIDVSAASASTGPSDTGQYEQNFAHWDANGDVVNLSPNTSYKLRVFPYGVTRSGKDNNQPFSNVVIFDDFMPKLKSCEDDSTPIVAENDNFTKSVTLPGGRTTSVFANDTLNNEAFEATSVIPSITDAAGLDGLVINEDGTLTIPKTATNGTYEISYQICEAANDTNCATATATIRVETPPAPPAFPNGPGLNASVCEASPPSQPFADIGFRWLYNDNGGTSPNITIDNGNIISSGTPASFNGLSAQVNNFDLNINADDIPATYDPSVFMEYQFKTNDFSDKAELTGAGWTVFEHQNSNDQQATGAYRVAILVDDDDDFSSPIVWYSDQKFDGTDVSAASANQGQSYTGTYLQDFAHWDPNGSTVELSPNTSYKMRVYPYDVTEFGDDNNQPYTNVVLWDDFTPKIITCEELSSNPAMTLTKVADNDTDRTVGDIITYTYTVENTGDVIINDITIDDQHTSSAGTSTLLVSSETGDANNSTNSNDTTANDGSWDVLAPGDIVTFTSSYTVTYDDLLEGNDITNSAMANGSPADGTLTPPTADESVSLEEVAPQLTMTKVADNDTNRAVGDVITYTYTVTNDGNVAVNDIAITDTHNGSDPAPTPTDETLETDTAPAGDSTDATPNDGNWDVLAPGDSVTFTGTYTVTADDAANL